jgi:hypothetical protein
MQITINIEDVHLQKQIAHYISDKNIQVNEFMIELLEHFFQKEEIAKTVENSQRIEGYEPVSEEVSNRLQILMKNHNVKVSF